MIFYDPNIAGTVAGENLTPDEFNRRMRLFIGDNCRRRQAQGENSFELFKTFVVERHGVGAGWFFLPMNLAEYGFAPPYPQDENATVENFRELVMFFRRAGGPDEERRARAGGDLCIFKRSEREALARQKALASAISMLW